MGAPLRRSAIQSSGGEIVKPPDLGGNHQTAAILRDGGYQASNGTWVDIQPDIRLSVANTVEYPPWSNVTGEPEQPYVSSISVHPDTVLSAGRRLAALGPVAALNFASASHPGGGFQIGVRGQEESIACASGLFACLEHQPMYEWHRTQADAMHSDYIIYSPDVPVFRGEDGQLLQMPWRLSILICPAVNARLLAQQAWGRLPDIPPVMRERTRKVLAVAVRHGHTRLVLGAWGCGVFGIDSHVIAEIFRDLLTTTFSGAFEQVVFAIADRAVDDTIKQFRQAFETPT